MLDMRAKSVTPVVVNPVPELLGAERRLADVGELRGQLLARQADQVAPPVLEQRRRRIEQRRLGEDARPLGRREIKGQVRRRLGRRRGRRIACPIAVARAIMRRI